MRVWVRWMLGVAIGTAIGGVPLAYYRASYAHAKRLRVVTEGRFYRSGQLPAEGFADAFRLYGIRCVVNLQEESRDPVIPRTWFDGWRGRPGISESELCKAHGVKYISLDGGVLDHPGQDTGSRPVVIDEFLDLLDDESNFPMLIHCKAGLHRTGLMTAVYRMDREHRTKDEAVRELKANGFGTFAATDGNLYIKRYIVDFEPSQRRKGGK